jgi:hypothetical protein
VNEFAFHSCYSLRKVALPSAYSIGELSFAHCYDLRHITLRPYINVDRGAFVLCLSLEVLAASTNFEIDTGDYDPYYVANFEMDDDPWNQEPANFETGDHDEGDRRNDPTRGITRYLFWRNSMDQRRELFYKTIVLVKLANPPPPESTIPARATTSDPIMNFLAEKGCCEIGFARHLLSFCPQFHCETRGKGDLRDATNSELLAVGLELKVLRKENNDKNADHWGIEVDDNGEIIGSDVYLSHEEWDDDF